MWNQRIEAVAKGGMAAIAEATIDRWFAKANQQRLGAEIARIRDGILNTPVAGYRACCGAIRDMDQRESIAAISLPTLVMVGAEDPSTPVAASELIHQRIAGSKLVVIPDSQHLFNVEEPAQFNAALLDFLAGVTAAAH
jgi:3-oxoadipate enol-lactonase